MKAVIAPPRVPSPSKNQRDFLFADMAKLADALDLGSSEATRAGSSPVIRIFMQNLGIIISEVFCVDELIKNIV